MTQASKITPTLTFVKWAGGKSQLLEQLSPLFPEKIDRYFEPFLGSGAVFFYIVQKFKPKEVFLSDVNDELITTYKVIQNKVDELIELLKIHKKKHTKNEKEYYYKIRSQLPTELSPVQRAARFIYLNRTCFNGLHRVNSKGQFNVPIGRYANPDIVQEEKLRAVSKLLKGVKIQKMSFEQILPLTKKGDFVYFDPPYYPLKRESFTSYAQSGFLEKEQQQLADLFDALGKKGCLCMESNSDTKFINKLYEKHTIKIVHAKRLINSKAEGRGAIREVVILNYRRPSF